MQPSDAPDQETRLPDSTILAPCALIRDIALSAPWLAVRLTRRCRAVSWSENRPGFVETDCVLWRQVRNADLPPALDVTDWIARELAGAYPDDAVVLLTSRAIDRYRVATATVSDVTATCIATVGLTNAERIGARVARAPGAWGTINILVAVDAGLADPAFLETLSIAAEARTVAIYEADHRIATGRATGTGTDCIAVVADRGDARYAGLHTEIGEAVGRAVYEAVSAAAKAWLLE